MGPVDVGGENFFVLWTVRALAQPACRCPIATLDDRRRPCNEAGCGLFAAPVARIGSDRAADQSISLRAHSPQTPIAASTSEINTL
jgi:hypothetical protein